MAFTRFATAGLLVFAVAAVPSAQQTAPQPAAEAVDVSRLPLNLAKIQQQLRQASVRDASEGLNIRYVVDVYGRAPRLQVLSPKDDNLRYGPVPYGAPTHTEILDMITPKEFRSPVMDFGAVLRWLQDREKK